MNLSSFSKLISRGLALAALFSAIALVPHPAKAGVMTFPGLTAIRFTEFSGGPIPHFFLPNSPQMTTQLGVLNAFNNDFQGVPTENYDVFYSDANGALNVNGNYVTVEARFAGQGGGGLNIAAVDLLLGPAPFMVCRADILSSFVGMGGNYIAGSEVLAVDPDLPIPATFTTMGNTAGIPGRLRVTVGWKKIIVPEPATATLVGLSLLTSVAVLRRRRRPITRSTTRSTRRTVMSQYRTLTAWSLLVALISYASFLTTSAQADPLPGRDLLKFSQKPMINTTVVDPNGTAGVYQGHDELSTAYRFANQPLFQGKFMADDFADKLSSPVVHVKWWGSYAKDFIDPNSGPVQRFLVSFESDVPQTAANPFSHPGQPLLNQVVSAGPLAPGSGTFTEKLIRGPDPILGESLYEYNAELHLGKDFPEKQDTVYWLKIVALVDAPTGVTFDPYNPQNSPVPVMQWGWHNRDYTIQDTLASTGLPSPPGGEILDGTIGATPVWHFQDDAVQGDVRIVPSATGGFLMPDVFQQNFVPQHYLDGIDGPAGGIPGTHGISQFSKDLAFELYTVVPEPTSGLLMLIGLAAVANRRRARRG